MVHTTQPYIYYIQILCSWSNYSLSYHVNKFPTQINKNITSEGLFLHLQKIGVSPPPTSNQPPCLNPVDDQFTLQVLMCSEKFFKKLLKFEGQFDLDGQGHRHQFRIHLGHV